MPDACDFNGMGRCMTHSHESGIRAVHYLCFLVAEQERQKLETATQQRDLYKTLHDEAAKQRADREAEIERLKVLQDDMNKQRQEMIRRAYSAELQNSALLRVFNAARAFVGFDNNGANYHVLKANLTLAVREVEKSAETRFQDASDKAHAEFGKTFEILAQGTEAHEPGGRG